MREDIRSNDDGELDGSRRVNRPDLARPLTDREVPIAPSEPRRLSPSLHAWLDGELSEADARRGSVDGDVDLWLRVGAMVGERRQLRAPSNMAARIMEVLPR